MMAYLSNLLPILLSGIQLTLIVYVATLSLSIPLGFLGALLTQSKIKGLTRIIDVFTWIIRGTPLLLQLYFVFYGLPILFQITIRDKRLLFAILTFTINYAAYFIEIFKGGFASIDPGQWDVSLMLELSRWTTLKSVIIPQVFANTIYVIGNEAITLVKDTALLATVALPDLLMVSKEALSRDARVDALVFSGVFYLLFTLIVVVTVKSLSQKWKVEV